MFIDCHMVEALVDCKWQIAFTGSRSHYNHHFRKHFGVPPEMVAALWNRVLLEPNSDNMRPEDVLWALYFLRQNPTENVGARFCQCGETTYRQRVWKMVKCLSQLKVVSKQVVVK